DVIELGARRTENFVSFELHRAGDPGLGRQQAERGEPRHRLSGAGLTDEADGLTFAQLQIDTVQDRNALEGDRELLDANEFGHQAQTPKLPARKSIAKAGAAFHLIDLGLAVKVAF